MHFSFKSDVPPDEKEKQLSRKAKEIKFSFRKTKSFIGNDEVPGQTWKDLDKLIEFFGLEQSELNYFYTIFCSWADVKIDINKKYNGSRQAHFKSYAISLSNFLKVNDFIKSNFSNMLLIHFADEEQNFTFTTFIEFIFNFCSLTKSILPKLLFQICQKNSKTLMQVSVARKLFNDCVQHYQPDFVGIEDSVLVRFACHDKFLRLTYFDEISFINLAKEYGEILFPIMNIQKILKRKILGLDWWKDKGQCFRNKTLRAKRKQMTDMFGLSKQTFQEKQNAVLAKAKIEKLENRSKSYRLAKKIKSFDDESLGSAAYKLPELIMTGQPSQLESNILEYARFVEPSRFSPINFRKEKVKEISLSKRRLQSTKALNEFRKNQELSLNDYFTGDSEQLDVTLSRYLKLHDEHFEHRIKAKLKFLWASQNKKLVAALYFNSLRNISSVLAKKTPEDESEFKFRPQLRKVQNPFVHEDVKDIRKLEVKPDIEHDDGSQPEFSFNPIVQRNFSLQQKYTLTDRFVIQ